MGRNVRLICKGDVLSRGKQGEFGVKVLFGFYGEESSNLA